MWSLVIFLCLSITWVEAQNGRGNDKGSRQDPNGHGWNIRLAVPGEPGNDYPTLSAIPRTKFSCAGKEPGYYADEETNCQAFRVCTIGSTYGFQSFLCPNGTLFNQAVFVCDWWMNVKCENTQQFININKNKFENLKLGPELMKDIKKMLTHPMRNPYDKSLMKNSQIVMQDYKAPNGQLFPNGALLSGPERVPNNIHVSAKPIQQNLVQSNQNDFIYSASTANPQYLANPAPANHLNSLQKSEDFFQKQRQSKQYTRNSRLLSKQDSDQNNNLIPNSQIGRFAQSSKSNLNNNVISQSPQAQTSTSQNNRRGQTKRQRLQNNDKRRIPQANNEKPTAFTDSFSETQNIQNTKSNQDNNDDYTPPGLPKFSSEIKGKVGKELKDNLVSRIRDIPTTVVTKTFSTILQESKAAIPKSQVTIKTWIIKPNHKKTKTSRQIADPTPYNYPRPSFPSPPPTEKLIDNTTPNIYTSSQSENIILTETDSVEPYIYNKPTIAAKQIQTAELETTPILVTPTLNPTSPTFLSSSPLILPATPSVPTKLSRYYLTPAPFTVTNRLYLPPPRDSATLPRLYLSPNALPQPIYYQSAQLKANPDISSIITPFQDYVNQSSFSLAKNSRNNLTFTDILTREKLDNTVNDIVKDTNNVLQTASPPVYNNYRQDFPKSLDIRQNDYTSTKAWTDSGESLTSQPPLQSTTTFYKSSQLIATPARSLVPPDPSVPYQDANPLSRLPYYKESGLLNTIERTVSIKITIPEHIAMYLFKNQSEADFDKLEILNTDSSNYLVLSNNNKNSLSNKNIFNFIPIAKLSENNNIQNISTSQALVYSFFSDSINLGREYRNLAEQEVLTSTATPTPAQFQNLNNQQISDITNKISNLTSSQFSSNHFYNIDRNANLISAQPTYTDQPIPFTGNLKFSTQHKARQIQSSRYNGIPSQPTQSKTNSAQLKQQSVQSITNPNEIYSGQLYRWPVPEVTNKIYNRPISENLINSNTLQYHTSPMLTLQRNSNQNNAADNVKQSSPEVEFIKAEIINLGSEPSYEPEQITSTEKLTNLLNDENGISAHVEDKIVGTIPHPLEENKLVTYRKDRSYYLYTKLDDNPTNENVPTSTQTNTITQQNDQQMPINNTPDDSTFQLIPSVNYELQDEKEQQQILDAFQIDEFGAPRDITKATSTTEKNNDEEIMTTSVGYSVDHSTAARRSDRLTVDPIYSGPSSYKAPQSSIGSLEKSQGMQSNFNARLEDFDSNNESGYPKQRPARRFIY